MASLTANPSSSPFWRPVDISHTALVLSDVQIQLLHHMPEIEREAYLTTIHSLLTTFRTQITQARAKRSPDSLTLNSGVPLIIHHTVPFGINSNAFVSPYNKLSTWATQRLKSAPLPPNAKDPNTPFFGVPPSLVPASGWSVDELLVAKLAPSCFMSSDLLKYLHARDIKHVVLVGLTTEGSILSSVRHGSDLDFHIIVPHEGVWCDDKWLGEVVSEKLLPRFADVVGVEDIKGAVLNM